MKCNHAVLLSVHTSKKYKCMYCDECIFNQENIIRQEISCFAICFTLPLSSLLDMSFSDVLTWDLLLPILLDTE